MLRDRVSGTEVQPTAPGPAHTFRFTTPVVPTPAILILAGWLGRLVRLLVLLPVRFPVATLSGVGMLGLARIGGWLALGLVVGLLAVLFGMWAWCWPAAFRKLVVLRLLAMWRWWWVYQRLGCLESSGQVSPTTIGDVRKGKVVGS